jgi:hypothetical protein
MLSKFYFYFTIALICDPSFRLFNLTIQHPWIFTHNILLVSIYYIHIYFALAPAHVILLIL